MRSNEHPYRLAVWHLRTKELIWVAEEARPARRLRDTRPKKGGSKTTAALGLLAALLVAGLMLLSGASPAHAATTFTVTNASDPGDGSCILSECTLREAIQAANLNGNASETDFIRFDISGTGPHTIRLTEQLPEITEPVVKDGYTQHGASPNTLSKGTNAKIMIELDGSNAEVDLSSNGLRVRAPNTVIKGLAINGFRGRGIWLVGNSTGVRLEGNFIGTDPAGTQDLGNIMAGVEIFGGPAAPSGAPSRRRATSSPATTSEVSSSSPPEATRC